VGDWVGWAVGVREWERVWERVEGEGEGGGRGRGRGREGEKARRREKERRRGGGRGAAPRTVFELLLPRCDARLQLLAARLPAHAALMRRRARAMGEAKGA
jgi:hypothetical protein